MKLRVIAAMVLVVLVAATAVFFLYPHNQMMSKRILENMAKARPPMEGVEYRVPFLYKEPPLAKYPESIVFADNAKLKFFELGADYWSSLPFMLEGETRTEETATKAHIRFKFNPPSDPLHPGYSIRAIESPLHKVTFQKAQDGAFYDLETAPASGWLKPLSAEAAAVWDLQPGDIIWVKSTESKKVTYAKFFIRLLSREGVAFDYVYQTDGTPKFPRPRN